MSRLKVAEWTALAMIAFAGNSLLCRVALRQHAMDAATFTAIRIASGALVLLLTCLTRRKHIGGNAVSAVALFAYAAAFSFAYISLPAGTGALLLFAAVQTTMITAGVRRGERLRVVQWLGIAIAAAGLVCLLLPGIAAPPAAGAMLMISAGFAWGIYSLRGRTTSDPLAATAGNFVVAVPFALALLALSLHALTLTTRGAALAVISGAITSGLGYVVWYAVLPALRATTAATVQLSAPVIAAIGGILFLGESVTLRTSLASMAVLGGIALAIVRRRDQI